MLNKLRLAPKLIASFVVIALIGTLVGIIGVRGLHQVGSAYEIATRDCAPSVEALLRISEAQQMVWVAERGLINRRMMDPEIRKAQYQYADEGWKQAQDAWAAYDKLPRDAEEDKQWKELATVWEEWKRLHQQVRSAEEQKDALLARGVSATDPQIEALDQKAYEASLQARTQALDCAQKLDGLVELANKSAAEAETSAQAATKRSTNMVVAAIVFGFLCSLAFGVLLARSIAVPMSQGVAMMQELGKGHLSQRLHLQREDEIGALAIAMDQFADDLQTQVVAVMRKIAEGDLSAEVSVHDGQDEIGAPLHKITQALRALQVEAERMRDAAVEGRLDARADVSKHRGDFRGILEGINDTLDALVGPVNETAAVLERVAARDLSARVTGDYKGDHARIKDALNIALDNLDQAFHQVNTASEQVASAANQISSGSQALAQGASEQASALEEVSSSLQEMASMTKQNAANAQEARSMTEAASTAANRGVETMRRLSEAIERIKASSDETAKIVKTIDEIAFQTNLLALNAAVEAARAGDAGKGFAVVAEEVRNLAMRSAEAAKNTADLIEESVNNAESGVAANQEVFTQLQDINDQVRKVGEVMAEIAAASEQQSQGIDQINSAVGQMDQVTQQAAANSEEAASAAEELSGQAEELRGMVGSFQLTGGSDPGTMRASAARTSASHRALPQTGRKPATVAATPSAHRDPRPSIPLPGDNGEPDTSEDHVVLQEF